MKKKNTFEYRMASLLLPLSISFGYFDEKLAICLTSTIFEIFQLPSQERVTCCCRVVFRIQFNKNHKIKGKYIELIEKQKKRIKKFIFF